MNPCCSPTKTSADELRQRAVAAYLGLALGDALGATVEFLTPREIAARHGVHRDIQGGGWLRLPAGAVTDDTTMALALGEAILAADGRVEALACARAFDAWMRGKPVDIGNTVRRNLVRFRRSGDPIAPPSEHDAGNGAAMRVLPVALVTFGATPEAITAAIAAQGHVTHHNVQSDAACALIVAIIHAALAGRDKGAILRDVVAPFVARHPEFAFRGRRVLNPSGWVVETMQAVLQAWADNDDFASCLIDVVNRGGDADTTGAIAGAIAGAVEGLAALPPRWLTALSPDVAARCRTQAEALICASPGWMAIANTARS